MSIEISEQQGTESDHMKARVRGILEHLPVIDLHTHLFAPEFGELNLWGIDELLTYHYLVAEYIRSSDTTLDEFWSWQKSKQADAIWQELFVKNTPLSEAACGVVGVLTGFGLNPSAPDLKEAREFFAGRDVNTHVNEVMQMAGVTDVVMTNDPLDDAEVAVWNTNPKINPHFHAVLRLDQLLNLWDSTCPRLLARGYDVKLDLSGKTIAELRRFVDEWVERMEPLYMAASLPDSWKYPEDSVRGRIMDQVIMPACSAAGTPMGLMVGVRRAVNPALRLAGDGLGYGDIRSVERIAEKYSENRFLLTMLSRENQHEMCVAARKFRNILIFGCWWFVNNPSMIHDISRMRFEMLGQSFVPQHSDCRILEQLVYKWRHSRRIVADALAESYLALERDGRPVSDSEMERDLNKMFVENFRKWTGNRL